MAKKRVVVFSADGCTPCEEVTKLIEQQRVSNPDIDQVEVVDIATNEGFARFNKEVLSKGNGGIPRAYLDGKQCSIEILEDNTIYFNCPNNDHPSNPEEISSPPVDGKQDDAAPSAPPASAPAAQQ